MAVFNWPIASEIGKVRAELTFACVSLIISRTLKKFAGANMREAKKVFVTDFDGTMTTYDFYTLVSRQLLSINTPDYWSEYRAGRLTHFEALRSYFAAIQADEATVLQLVEQMEIDPHLAVAVAQLQRRGWKIVIASAGCGWYIERLLARAGVQIETHANPGHFEAGHGLLMDLPRQSPFFSPTHGIDKAGLVKHYLDSVPRLHLLEMAFLMFPPRC